MAKYVLRYTGQGFLHIRDLGVTFKKGDSFDMVSKTELDINKIKNHKDISPYIGNLLIEELVEYDPAVSSVTIVKEQDNSELNKKMDLLLKSLTPEVLGEMVKNALKDKIVFSETGQKNIENHNEEDEETRKELLKDLVFKKDSKIKANLEGYGKLEEKVKNDEAEGLDGLIDF